MIDSISRNLCFKLGATEVNISRKARYVVDLRGDYLLLILHGREHDIIV